MLQVGEKKDVFIYAQKGKLNECLVGTATKIKQFKQLRLDVQRN